jgi:membrane protein HdeD
MKSLNYALVSSLCALVIGILLVTWPDVAVSYLVITIGVLFLIPGLVGLFSYLALLNKSKADAPRPVFPIVALGSTLFGVWLIIMPSFFVGVLMYVLGILLVLGGISQLANLIAARSFMPVPFGVYIVPVLILAAGITVLFNPFAASHFYQRTNNGPNHIPQETVCLNGKYPFRFAYLLPVGVHNLAVIGFHIRMQFTEARKIRVIEQGLCCLIHLCKIQRLEQTPAICPVKRILLCGNVVFVRTISRIKTGMRILIHSPHTVHRYIRRQQTVQFIRHRIFIQHPFHIKMCHHQAGMYSSIRTSGPHHFNGLIPQESMQRFHQRFLHTASVRLYLPAMIVSTVVSQINELSEHNFLNYRAVIWKQPCFNSYFT